MARITLELPNDIIENVNKVYSNADEIFGAMTKAGAEVAETNVRKNLPEVLKKSKFMSCVKITRTYKTPSDGGINNAVIIDGYFDTQVHEEKGHKRKSVLAPAPLVANLFEYGRSNAPFPKKPFFRKSFRKAQIEKAMKAAQRSASGGLLDDE